MSTFLSVLDNLFWQLESPTTPMHVGGVLVFRGDGMSAAEQCKRMCEAPVTVHPFDVQVTAGRRRPPRWRPVRHVDPRTHVSTWDVPSPGDDEQLMALVSRLHTRPIDRTRPLWECHVICGLAGDRFALYYKIHHSCIDGVTGIRRIQRSLSATPDESTPPVWAAAEPPRSPRQRTSKFAATARMMRGNARMVPELTRAIVGLRRAASKRDDLRSSAPYASPDTPLNKAVSGQRSVAWCSLPLQGVRTLGTAGGATVNEIALALCSTILRERLLDMGGLPNEPLVAMVPFSLRGDGDGDGADAGAGNAVSCILCNLATHVADPGERLRIIRASSSDGKRMLRAMSPQAAATYWLVVGFPAIASQLAGMVDRSPLPFNVVVSNVPGPTERLYHNGSTLEAIYPASLLFERQALNITLTSYRDRLDIGLLSCSETIPDLPYLAGRIRVAYEQLASSLGVDVSP